MKKDNFNQSWESSRSISSIINYFSSFFMQFGVLWKYKYEREIININKFSPMEI